jgi:hypothetical protein
MKIALSNEITFRKLENWIDRVAYAPERHDLSAWMREAEQTANDSLPGESIILEMRGIATESRNPETLIMYCDDFEWLEIEENN